MYKPLQIYAPQTGNAKNPPLNRPPNISPPRCTWKIVLKYKVKHSKNGKFTCICKASPIHFETQISLRSYALPNISPSSRRVSSDKWKATDSVPDPITNQTGGKYGLPGSMKILREFYFADWRFFVVCGNKFLRFKMTEISGGN